MQRTNHVSSGVSGKLHNYLRFLAIVFTTVICLQLGSGTIGSLFSSVNPNIQTTNTAKAKSLYWKYGKLWLWTSGVKSLGKHRIYKHNKAKSTVYRVYVSRNDIKQRRASGLTVAGNLKGKGLALIMSLIGSNLSAPKHGYRYDTQYVNQKYYRTTNFHRWH